MREPLNLRDVVAIKNQSLQIRVLVGILNFINEVACVVNEFKVGRGIEIESSSNLVPCCFQFNQVLEV